uniref:E3 ubiquitin-protein ligase MARCHF7 isoform X2 n=1 Tax=Myxine glutinosa TaxID=7769 RepID=UPI0035901238
MMFSSMNSTRAHDSNRGVSSPGLEGATAGRELSPVSEEASKRPKLGSSSLGASSGIPDNARGHPSATTTASIRDMGSSMHRINRGLPSNVRLTGTSQLWNRDVDVSDWEVGELSGGQRDVWRPQDFGTDQGDTSLHVAQGARPRRLYTRTAQRISHTLQNGPANPSISTPLDRNDPAANCSSSQRPSHAYGGATSHTCGTREQLWVPHHSSYPLLGLDERPESFLTTQVGRTNRRPSLLSFGSVGGRRASDGQGYVWQDQEAIGQDMSSSSTYRNCTSPEESDVDGFVLSREMRRSNAFPFRGLDSQAEDAASHTDRFARWSLAGPESAMQSRPDAESVGQGDGYGWRRTRSHRFQPLQGRSSGWSAFPRSPPSENAVRRNWSDAADLPAGRERQPPEHRVRHWRFQTDSLLETQRQHFTMIDTQGEPAEVNAFSSSREPLRPPLWPRSRRFELLGFPNPGFDESPTRQHVGLDTSPLLASATSASGPSSPVLFEAPSFEELCSAEPLFHRLPLDMTYDDLSRSTSASGLQSSSSTQRSEGARDDGNTSSTTTTSTSHHHRAGSPVFSLLSVGGQRLWLSHAHHHALESEVRLPSESVNVSTGGDENKDGACLPHSRDPERLRQIQERLLQEESDEEEGDICRICQTGAVSEENPLLTPCGCSGSLHFVHQACMMRWLEAKIKAGADPHTVLICELCKQRLTIDMPDFDIYRLYQQHSSTQVQDNFVSSGLYLVLLLHLCEQRFADVASTPQQRPRSGRLFRLAQFLQRQRQDEPESSDDEIEDLPSYHATVQDGTILITQSRRRREL